jgi:hypothetical protein
MHLDKNSRHGKAVNDFSNSGETDRDHSADDVPNGDGFVPREIDKDGCSR